MAELTFVTGDEAKEQSLDELMAHLASSPKGLSTAEAEIGVR